MENKENKYQASDIDKKDAPVVKTSEPKEDNNISDEMGIIAKGTKVIGDITTNGHLAIYGEIEGNIYAKGNIVATGKICGDISCSNIRLTNCSAKTNLNVKNTVNIDENASVEGKVLCGKISVDGVVKGDIEAKQEISIFQNAKVIGNIKAKSLGIESGAELQGNVMVVK